MITAKNNSGHSTSLVLGWMFASFMIGMLVMMYLITLQSHSNCAEVIIRDPDFVCEYQDSNVSIKGCDLANRYLDDLGQVSRVEEHSHELEKEKDNLRDELYKCQINQTIIKWIPVSSWSPIGGGGGESI